MRQLPVGLPPTTGPERPRNAWRDAFFFLAAFVAVFIAAFLVIDLLGG